MCTLILACRLCVHIYLYFAGLLISVCRLVTMALLFYNVNITSVLDIYLHTLVYCFYELLVLDIIVMFSCLNVLLNKMFKLVILIS